MSNSGPRYRVAMAEHSRCQPGRPGPQGVSHCGSPGSAPSVTERSGMSNNTPLGPGTVCGADWAGGPHSYVLAAPACTGVNSGVARVLVSESRNATPSSLLAPCQGAHAEIRC